MQIYVFIHLDSLSFIFYFSNFYSQVPYGNALVYGMQAPFFFCAKICTSAKTLFFFFFFFFFLGCILFVFGGIFFFSFFLFFCVAYS